MLRRSARTTPLYALALATMVLALFAAPALAHKEGTGGKKALGTVASFDGTTLTVTMTDGSSFSGAVGDDVQVKVEHRGHKSHGKGHKKPSNGSVADLTAGAMVLRMKVKCDEVTKLRLRRVPAAAPVVEATPVVEAAPVVITASTDAEAEDLETEDAETEDAETEDSEESDDGCSDDDDDTEEVETEDESDDDADDETEAVEVEEEATV